MAIALEPLTGSASFNDGEKPNPQKKKATTVGITALKSATQDIFINSLGMLPEDFEKISSLDELIQVLRKETKVLVTELSDSRSQAVKFATLKKYLQEIIVSHLEAQPQDIEKITDIQGLLTFLKQETEALSQELKDIRQRYKEAKKENDELFTENNKLITENGELQAANGELQKENEDYKEMLEGYTKWLEGLAKGRAPLLSENDVPDIKEKVEKGMKNTQIAREYGLNEKTVRNFRTKYKI